MNLKRDSSILSPTDVSLRDLISLHPHANPEQLYFGGKLIRRVKFNPNTKLVTLTIADGTSKLDIQLAGEWAREPDALISVGEVLKFRLGTGTVKERKRKGDNESTFDCSFVEYPRGVAFWTRPGVDEADEEDWSEDYVFPSNGIWSRSSVAPSESSAASSSNAASSHPNAKGNKVLQESNSQSSSNSNNPGQRSKKRGGKVRMLLDKGSFKVANVLYSQLKDIDAGRPGRYSIIAIGIATCPPAPARNSATRDWSAPLHLYDPSMADYYAANIFTGGDVSSPHAGEEGSVVILRQLNKSAPKAQGGFTKQVTGYKDKLSFAVLPIASLLSDSVTPTLTAPRLLHPFAAYGVEEIAYAKELAEWWTDLKKLSPDNGGIKLASKAAKKAEQKEIFKSAVERSLERASRKGAGGSAGRKRILVEELGQDMFADLFVEVAKFYCEEDFQFISDDSWGTLYVTDYTKNPSLFLYAVDNTDSLPSGQQTLQISIRGHANLKTCFELKRGTMVSIRNVRGKMGKSDFLEANVYVDEKHLNRSDLVIYNKSREGMDVFAELVAGIKTRRDAYYATTVNPAAQEPEKDSPKPMSISKAPVFGIELDEDEEDSMEASPISCQYDEQPLCKMDIALRNRKERYYHCRGRVIDFQPSKLEEWTSAQCQVCHNEVDRILDECCGQTPRFEFTFDLAIEEESSEKHPPCMQVTFPADVALKFLPGIKPSLETRQKDTPGFNALRTRLAPLLRGIEKRKMIKQKIRNQDASPYFDFAVFAAYTVGKEWSFRFEGTSLPGK